MNHNLSCSNYPSKMNFQIKIEDRTVCTGTVAESISEQDFVAALMKVVDRFTSISECDINIKARPTMDALWLQWLEALALAHDTTSAALMGKSLARPLPNIRAILADAWIEVTDETELRVAVRMGMHHTSIGAARDRINDKGRHDKRLRQMHLDGIDLCRAIVNRNMP